MWSYMLLAEGALDIVAEVDLQPYDMAALIPIIEALPAPSPTSPDARDRGTAPRWLPTGSCTRSRSTSWREQLDNSL